MTPLVTIITPTYNKPVHFADCAEAVLAQSFQPWTWWVIFNRFTWDVAYDEELARRNLNLWADPRVQLMWVPVTEVERRGKYVPAYIINQFYPKVTTPYILFLADDDLIVADGLAALTPQMDGREAVYGGGTVLAEELDGTYTQIRHLHPGDLAQSRPIPSACDNGLGTGLSPDCLIDGGQVLHTKALWDQATADGWRLDESLEGANFWHIDGVLLARLGQFARFHYMQVNLLTKRCCYLSHFSRVSSHMVLD